MATLRLQFQGWCLIRLTTDPDPSDEPRGISGYTFAFAGEPNLDGVIRLQPPSNFLRPHSEHGFGVSVQSAERLDGVGGPTDVPALRGARVNLLGRPKLANRNHVLTQPGFEPIVPFHLQISRKGIRIRRKALLDVNSPNRPVWKTPSEDLAKQGAAGMAYEPDTIARATGISDSLAEAKRRCDTLKGRLKVLQDKQQRNGEDLEEMARLEGRIAELKIGIKNPSDRRIFTRYFVERFGFQLLGKADIQGDEMGILGGNLDRNNPWEVRFWMGAWDPDLLCAFMQGSLLIPYV